MLFVGLCSMCVGVVCVACPAMCSRWRDVWRVIDTVCWMTCTVLCVSYGGVLCSVIHAACVV